MEVTTKKKVTFDFNINISMMVTLRQCVHVPHSFGPVKQTLPQSDRRQEEKQSSKQGGAVQHCQSVTIGQWELFLRLCLYSFIGSGLTTCTTVSVCVCVCTYAS